MAKYYGREGVRVGKIGNEVYYQAFEANIIRERVLKKASPNTRRNIITKARFGSVNKFIEYCLDPNLLRFFPDIKGAKMKRSSILKTNKNNYLPMHKKYYKKSSLIAFGVLELPGNNECVLRYDGFKCKIMNQEDNYNGLLVSYICEEPTCETVAQFTNLFIITYPEIQPGNIIHFYGTLCKNCYSRNDFEDPIVVEGNCQKRYIHRQVTLSLTDNTKLKDLGLEVGMIAMGLIVPYYKAIVVPLFNKYKVFDSAREYFVNPGTLHFWVETPMGTIHPKGGMLQCENFPYRSIMNSLLLPNSIISIETSWKMEDIPIVD